MRKRVCTGLLGLLLLLLLLVPAGAEQDVAAPDGGQQSGMFTSLSQLNGKRIGVQTGTTFDEIVLETLPDAQISYFNTYPDMAAATEANKIDGFPGDEPVLRLIAAENSRLASLDERMDSFMFGFVLPKNAAGEKLLAELDAWITAVTESGELDGVVSKWTSGPEEDKTLPDYAAYPAPKGVLTMATGGAYAPMNYYRGDELALAVLKGMTEPVGSGPYKFKEYNTTGLWWMGLLNRSASTWYEDAIVTALFDAKK